MITISYVICNMSSTFTCSVVSVLCHFLLLVWFLCGSQIIFIRENILHLTDPSSAEGIIETVISSDVCLENFHPIDLHELTKILSSSKSSTCILDPIPTRLLKEVLRLIINY